MPKKQPRNAFYFYMINLKEEQRKKGVHYANMQEIAEAAGPLWREAPPAVRTKFEEMAKREKQKYNIPLHKFTSTGISYAALEQRDKEIKDAQEAELQDIKNLVKLKNFDGSILKEDFFLMDVNSFCKCNGEFLIGESTILRFTIQDGVKNNYHELVNPGVIPIGYASDVLQGSKDLGLEMPDESTRRSNYVQILANIIDFLRSQSPNTNSIPPIFTMPDKVEQVQDFIHQMCRTAAEDETIFRVYRLDTLFFTLINAIKTQQDEGFPKESLAIAQLKKDQFKYTPKLGCQHHEEAEMSIECTTSRVKRWAFTILDSCCPIVGVEVIAGKHIPHDFDVEGILIYKEQKRERPAPTVADSNMSRSSCGGSVASDSKVPSSVEAPNKPKRVHVPLRQPKKDYAQSIRLAPNLSETDFPKLGEFPQLGAGRGRGRSLGSSFNSLNLND